MTMNFQSKSMAEQCVWHAFKIDASFIDVASSQECEEMGLPGISAVLSSRLMMTPFSRAL